MSNLSIIQNAYATAIAVGRDVGNRRMTRDGRTIWNADDYFAACVATNKVLIEAGWDIAEDHGANEGTP